MDTCQFINCARYVNDFFELCCTTDNILSKISSEYIFFEEHLYTLILNYFALKTECERH